MSAFQIGLKSFSLPNGLKVWVQEDPATPTVSISISYKVGSRHEQKGRSGFAHLFEHLMFEGTESTTPGEFSKLIEANGGVDNAYTSRDHTNYHEMVPSQLLDLALWLEADRMRSLVVSKETLEREKSVVQEEIRLRILNRPYMKAVEEDLEFAAFAKWENQHSVAGTLEDVGNARLPEVQQFFKTHYGPNNAVLVLVGDVTFEEARRMVERHFGPVPAAPLPAEPDLAEPAIASERRITVSDPLAKLPQLVAVWHTPEEDSKDFWALALLMEHLASGEESPLHRSLVKEKQLAISTGGYYPLWSSLYDYRSPDLFAVTVLYRPDAPAEDVVKAADAVLSEIARTGLDAGDLERVKARMKFGWLTDFQFPFDRAKHFSAYAATRGEPEGLETDLAACLAVTPQDIADAVKKRMPASARVVMDIRPAAAGPASAKAEPAEPEGEVEEAPGRIAAAIARDGGAARPVPGGPRPVRVPGIRRITLPNGIEAVLAADRRLPLLQIRLALHTGAGDGPAGVGEAAAELLLKGTDKEDARRVAEGFSALGGRLEADGRPDDLILAGAVLAENAPAFLERLAGVAAGAAFPEAEVELWRRNMAEELKLRRHDPGFLADERLDQLLFKAHPYAAGSPTLESLAQLDRGAVERWYRGHAGPEGAILVLAGDLPAGAEELAARTVGAWKAKGRPTPAKAASPSDGARLQLVHRSESQQANILIRGFLELKRSDPEYYAFALFNYVLGGGFSSRLNQNLRVRNGFTYGVYSQPDLRRQATLLEIGTEVRAEVVAAAITETLAEVERLRKEGVTAEELEGAKRFLEGTFAMRLAHQSRFAGQLLALRMEGIDPEQELANYVQKVAAVTPADVSAAAARLLDPGSLRIAVVGDAAELAPKLATLGLSTETVDTEGKRYSP